MYINPAAEHILLLALDSILHVMWPVYLWLKDWRGCLLSLWLRVHVHGVRRVIPGTSVNQTQKKKNSVNPSNLWEAPILRAHISALDSVEVRTLWYFLTPKWVLVRWELLSFAAPHHSGLVAANRLPFQLKARGSPVTPIKSLRWQQAATIPTNHLETQCGIMW